MSELRIISLKDFKYSTANSISTQSQLKYIFIVWNNTHLLCNCCRCGRMIPSHHGHPNTSLAGFKYCIAHTRSRWIKEAKHTQKAITSSWKTIQVAFLITDIRSGKG